MKTIKEFKSDNWSDKLICDFLIGRSKLNLEERVFLSEYLFRLEKQVENNVVLADVSKRLPTDEEIQDAANKHEWAVSAGNAGIYINDDFIEGASWMLRKYLSENTK